MRKWHEKKWEEKAAALIEDTALALQTVYDSLNQGQRKQIVKDDKVKVLFDRYGVIYE